MTITHTLYKNARKIMAALAACAALALASCSAFDADPQGSSGAITVRLPDQEAISALCAADGIAKNITSDQTTLGQQGQMIQSFKVEARNLAQKKTISQKVAPGATVTIDSLVPGDWDVVIFGYEYSDQHPMFYGNSRGIKVNAGETSQAAVVLNRVEPNTQFSVELEAATSAASLTEDGRANVKKVYVTYEGVELSQKGAAFFTYSDTASQNVMQPSDKNKMLVPVEDFLEPGYSYNAQVYLFGDVLDGYTALWSGNFSGVVQSDGKLVCNLNFLNDYLRIPTGAPVNWQDIKMDQDIQEQLSTQMCLAFEVHTYGAPDGNPKDYSELEIFPAVADACGEVPLIVRYGNLAWTYMFSFRHPVILPTVTVPDQFPLGVAKAFQEVLSPAAPQEWPQCGNDSYYDSYGLLKYYVNGVDKDTWGTIEYASPTGTAQHYYETPVGGSTPTKAQTVNTDADTCSWTKRIENNTYGYFEGGGDYKDLSGYFTVTGTAWTATPSTIEVEKGGTFKFTLTNAAANAADCQTAAADLNFADKQGSIAITATPTASGESVVVTATAPSSWAAGSSKSLSVLFGSVGSALGAGTITVNVTDSSGGGGGSSGSVVADIYVSSTGSSSGEGTKADPLDSIANAVAKIKAAPDSTKDWVIGIDGTLEGCQVLEELAATEAKSLTLTGINGFDAAAGKPKDWLDGNSGWDVKLETDDIPDTCHTLLNAVLTFYAVTVPVKITDLGIKGGYSDQGGGINFMDSLKLTLGENAYITENLCYSNGMGGGGISGNYGEVILDGGTITKNKARSWANGGGVYVKNDCTFTLKSGTISNNWTDYGSGAGVYVTSGAIFNMEGGSIENNATVNDSTGGVCIKGEPTVFNMTSGTISGNLAWPNGTGSGPSIYSIQVGVYVDAGLTLNMSGDAIVDSNNSVVLNNSTSKVFIAGNITSAIAPVATITPSSSGETMSYNTTVPVLDAAFPDLITAYYTYFAITPKQTMSGTENWVVTNEGKPAKSDAP
ncbi:MAG: right-handed parallel beta-helix repeat-containing protein [Treponema sp.]|nr:right-handed parallel beta-helix repeat-containing protein [Treponema sp.]